MPRKPQGRCSTCGRIGPCRRHQTPRTLTTAQRGYGYTHQQVERDDHCADCGATDDLVRAHIVDGDPTQGWRTLCRPCNTAEGNRTRSRRLR